MDVAPAGTSQVEISLWKSLEKRRLKIRPGTHCRKCDYGCVMAVGSTVLNRNILNQEQIT